MKKNSNRQSVISDQLKNKIKYRILVFLLFAACCPLFADRSSAEETQTTISADNLEYDKKTLSYAAKGSVKVQQGEATLTADEMKYNEETGDAFAEGDVRYNDPDIILKAEKAEYNLKTKKGRFYNADIFSKKDNLHVSGAEVEKRGENEYFLDRASATTCNAPLPAWCFKGKDADIIIGDRLKAKDVTFNIKNTPVFYSPYLWMPINTERETGFLTPEIGYSKTKGIYFRQPFFWAIDENKDATFILDWYSKRGFGEGIEYRYVDIGNVQGKHWLYHIYDVEPDKSILEFRSLHEKREDDFSAYLNLNLINDKNFYREYSKDREERIMRYLDSTAEASIYRDDSRLYLMSRYLIDLKQRSRKDRIVQRLPEIGYVINPEKIGPIVFSLASSASNFWRKEGMDGQRLDIYPKLSHSFGDEIVIFQNLGLRGTAYSLHRNEDRGYDSSVFRETFDYNITASSRIAKNYDSFFHAIEPSLGYIFAPRIKDAKTKIPLFDSTDLYSRLSMLDFSVMNRLISKRGEFLTLKLSTAYNFHESERPFMPLKMELAVKGPVRLRGDISYSTYSGRIESANSDVNINLHKAALSIGERYNRNRDTMFYDFGINFPFSKNLSTEARVWYDANGGGLRDMTLRLKYQKQCWGVTMSYIKKPGDYSITVTFDLLGLGSLKV